VLVSKNSSVLVLFDSGVDIMSGMTGKNLEQKQMEITNFISSTTFLYKNVTLT